MSINFINGIPISTGNSVNIQNISKIVYGTQAGTGGLYGVNHKTTINFPDDFYPIIVYISNYGIISKSIAATAYMPEIPGIIFTAPLVLHRGHPYELSETVYTANRNDCPTYKIITEWGAHSVTWYSAGIMTDIWGSTSGNDDDSFLKMSQLNYDTIYYTALGSDPVT